MGPIGLPEMMAIFTIALLLFGPKKLPELGRTLGKALSEFRRAKNELKTTFESHLQELERETRIDTQPTKYLSSDTESSSSHYPYPYEDNHYDPSSYSSSAAESTTASSEPALLASSEPTHAVSGGGETLAAAEPVEGTIHRTNGTQSSAVHETVSSNEEQHG